jgi:hypothetical protein
VTTRPTSFASSADFELRQPNASRLDPNQNRYSNLRPKGASRADLQFHFFLAARPKLWVTVTALLGAGYVLLVFELSWDERVIFWVVIAATILSWPPAAPDQKVAQLADVFWAEAGVTQARLKNRVGLLGFALFSGIAYTIVFGQICNYENQCTPFYRAKGIQMLREAFNAAPTRNVR